jgi:S1-C subfamily serine protease
VVVGITVQSPLFRAGARPGDIIIAVNGWRIGTVDELLNAATGSGPWTLGVKRDGADLFVVLQ